MNIYKGKPHKDCPFTREEIDEFKAALYMVNTSFKCCNPAAISWVDGYQRWQGRNKVGKADRTTNLGTWSGYELTFPF